MNEKMYKASDVIGILLEEITNAEFLRVTKRLSDIPSSVVRCKYCEHWKREENQVGEIGDDYFCAFDCNKSYREDFFCADGERKKDASKTD